MKGWWHPERGYWETPNNVGQRYIDAYPAGTVQVPQRPVQAGKAYTWDGSAWQESNAVVAVPPHVTRFQFKTALHRSGQLDNVKSALQDAGIGEEVRIYWQESEVVTRNGALIAAIKTAMSLNDAQIDNFFRTASEIKP